jgi:hypothetical protein
MRVSHAYIGLCVRESVNVIVLVHTLKYPIS